jgi:hypothetical protein
MRRALVALPVLAATMLFADDKRPPDNREQVGIDQVTVYWCPCFKTHWTQVATDAQLCPLCDPKKHADCGEKKGEYKVVVKTSKAGIKPGAEASLDIEVFEIVVDKDAKPDEVRVMDVATVKAKLSRVTVKDGEETMTDEGEVQEASISGKERAATVKVKPSKKGEYALGIEINRGDKESTKIESEVRFTVD